jgi:Rrf2 family iron-sulfur cluster assembly transcriptional regulator
MYAVRAALTLAEAPEDTLVTVDEISGRLDVPRNYLSKILHAMARGGVLTSTRGPGGGFRLARPASELTLSDIVRHFDDLPDSSGCLLGRERCSDDDPCAAHDRWKSVSASVRDFFNKTTLVDLSRSEALRSATAQGL